MPNDKKEILRLRSQRDELKSDAKIIAKELAEVDGRLLELLNEEDDNEFISDGRVLKIDRKRYDRYDPIQVKENLGPILWEMVCREVLDEDLLEKAVADGNVEPSLLRGTVTTEYSKPFIASVKQKREAG